jgi:hypothetical protein
MIPLHVCIGRLQIHIAIAQCSSAFGPMTSSTFVGGLDGYQDLSRRHLAELRNPRITLGRSIELIAAAGAGFLLAGAIRE